MDQSTKKIAFIQAGWHAEIVSQARISFTEGCEQNGVQESQIEVFTVPGSLEIPLQVQRLARTGKYSVIIAAGLIVDGGIYRHDFVASTVLNAMMQVQLKTEVPVLSVVLTPHHYQETEAHEKFFLDHFKIKGKEAAEACVQTLRNISSFNDAA